MKIEAPNANIIINIGRRSCKGLSMPKTQENKRAPKHREYQVERELNGKTVWVDPELYPLLKALNDVGLITRSHCCGHGDNPAWVAIKLDSLVNAEFRIDETYNELLVTWWPEK